MPVEAIAIVATVLVASFFLVPNQIILATANRVDERFAQFKGQFPYSHRRRLLIGTIGSAAALGSIFLVDQPVIPSVLISAVLLFQYISDVYIVEGIARDLR